jgi:UDP-N-acetylglucosamine 2-epimerase (non-hydrolysing)
VRVEAAQFTNRPVVCVVGARPNFMKMAPILRAFAAHPSSLATMLVHTGQHYDTAMNERLFADLRLPHPDINLEVGSGTHATQTAEIMRRFEPVLDRTGASCVLVVGDVNSTLACSLVAAKKKIPVVHVEAGLRSFDRAMPEEINRVLTDQIADLLYTTEATAQTNLAREGIAAERIRFVGNVMIDCLLAHRPVARVPRETVKAAGFDAEILNHPHGYAVITLHRPSNVDTVETLKPLLELFREIAQQLPLVFAVHPRTRENIERFGLSNIVALKSIMMLPPQGYLEMLGLMSGATLVLTDSGGLQEETTALGVPCLTLRENTERPITVEQGTNTLVGRDRTAALCCVSEILSGAGKRGRRPDLWDGNAAQRIVADLAGWLVQREAQPIL